MVAQDDTFGAIKYDTSHALLGYKVRRGLPSGSPVCWSRIQSSVSAYYCTYKKQLGFIREAIRGVIGSF